MDIKKCSEFLTENKGFKNTDEEILMYFTDYYDEDPNNFSIKNVFVHGDRIVGKSAYIKDPKAFRKAKVVTIKLQNPGGRWRRPSIHIDIKIIKSHLIRWLFCKEFNGYSFLK